MPAPDLFGLIATASQPQQLRFQAACKRARMTTVSLPPDPHQIWAALSDRPCDFLLLDIGVVRKYGFMLLRMIARRRSLPVFLLQDDGPQEQTLTLEAQACGALEAFRCPPPSPPAAYEQVAQRIRQCLTGTPPKAPPVRPRRCRFRLIAIGASAGGPPALARVLQTLPAAMPPILIVQHMPALFTGSFAERLNQNCALEVVESRPGLEAVPGRAILARGGVHMRVVCAGTRLSVRQEEDPPVSGHRPSVDALFHSVAEAVSASIGVILTGMGADGADGLRRMRGVGAHTIAQDEDSCAVYGMPREAVRLDAAVEVLPLDRIAARLEALTTPPAAVSN